MSEVRWKFCLPISGSTARSSPTIRPTNALIRTSSENCDAFSRSPSRTWCPRTAAGAVIRLMSGRPERFAATIVACCPRRRRDVAHELPRELVLG